MRANLPDLQFLEVFSRFDWRRGEGPNQPLCSRTGRATKPATFPRDPQLPTPKGAQHCHLPRHAPNQSPFLVNFTSVISSVDPQQPLPEKLLLRTIRQPPVSKTLNQPPTQSRTSSAAASQSNSCLSTTPRMPNRCPQHPTRRGPPRLRRLPKGASPVQQPRRFKNPMCISARMIKGSAFPSRAVTSHSLGAPCAPTATRSARHSTTSTYIQMAPSVPATPSTGGQDPATCTESTDAP